MPAETKIHVANPPPKPLLVYDGECNFCKRWIRRWKKVTGETVDYLPSQDPRVIARFPEIPPKEFAAAAQLIETDGAVYAAAEAIFRTLAYCPNRQWPLCAYRKSPAFAGISETIYRFVARHRAILLRITF